jgi:hypothetical protein
VPAWGPKAQKDLKEKIELRKKLLSLDQQSELLTVRYQKVRALENTLIKIQAELSAKNINFYSDLIKEFCLLKEKRLSTKEKTLQNYHIPGVKIAEWEGFIRAGENYISSLQSENHSEYDEYCIYCRQRLTTTSKKLVDLYRELSKNEKTSDYSKISVKINDIVSSLDRIFYRDNFPYLAEDFDKIINKKLIATALITMVNGDNLIHEIKEGFNNLRLKKIGPPKITGIINKIRKSKIKIEADIEKLKDDRINYSTRIRELDSRIIELQDVHAFSLNKSKLEKYILIKGWVEKALALQANKFSTKPITDLAKKAWKEMVSDSFVECFKNEATNLRAPTVKLEFRGEYGSQIREKSLDGLNEIDKFLSEGEQKAVALADLFSELAMRHEKTPVIFDDPATSFDYDRKKIIAERIIKESDSRQIIVFTHDLVFTSYLYDKVLDKNGKIDTSKANFHNMHAEDNKVGLITENYYPGSTKFDDDIQKIDSRVLHLESLSGEELDDGIRSLYSKLRRAVEKAVEERIFGGIITRWTDRIQMFNIPKASLNKGKLDKARSLHDKFCSFTDAHYQSNEAAQHFTLSISNLKDDIQNVKDIAIR